MNETLNPQGLRPIAMYNLIEDFRITTSYAKGDAHAASSLVALLNMALAALPRHEQVVVLAKMNEMLDFTVTVTP